MLGQQHQRGAAAAPGCVLRPGQPGALAGDRAAGSASSCQPAIWATRFACVWARRRGPAHRPDRPGDQCQCHHSGLPRHGPVAAPAERADAGLRHGRRQSEQHGASSRLVRGHRQRCGRKCPQCRWPTTRFAARSSTSSVAMACLVPAHGHGLACLPGTAGAGARTPGLGGGRHRPRRQVRHHRGAAARHPAGATCRTQALLQRPTHFETIPAELAALAARL